MDQTQSTGMPVMQPKGNGKKIGISIAVVIIILAIGGYLLLRKPAETTNPGIVAGDMNSITVSDQDADSVAVLVSNASLRAPGYIVIHEDNGGIPGAVIGISQLLSPGNYNNISVIANPLAPGKSYIAMLHGDDGNRTFSESVDVPLTDNAGKVVMTSFKIKLSSIGGEVKG